MRSVRRFASVLALILIPGLALAADTVAGRWNGAIEIPGGSAPLAVSVVLEPAQGAWKGTVDIPAQMALGLRLEPVSVDGPKVRFAIHGIPGDPVFEGTLAGDEIRGTFTQSGTSMPFALRRARRPQEPKPPFPYSAEDVSYTNGDVKLAGTLTVPPGSGPFPAVLLLTGSGAQNRDEELFGHKPFAVLADHLTRAGIAVLRVDDRGVGGSTGASPSLTAEDLAGDALAGVRFLKSRRGIDPGRIGLLGHSEGGMVAPIAASRSGEVGFVILLAGPGVPGYDMMLRQIEQLNRSAGLPQNVIVKNLAIQRRIMDLVRQEKNDEALRGKLRELLRAELTGAPDAFLDAKVQEAMFPGFRALITHDPRPALRQVKVPVLALNGALDLQVDAEQNLPEIEKTLKDAGNKDVTVRRLPGLNHLFQTAKTGTLVEYVQIEETISPELLDVVTRWIVERFGKPAPQKPK